MTRVYPCKQCHKVCSSAWHRRVHVKAAHKPRAKRKRPTPVRDTKRDAYILKLYTLGYTKSQIARAIGVSRQRLQQLMDRIFDETSRPKRRTVAP